MRKNHRKTIPDIINGYFHFENLWTGMSSISLAYHNDPLSTGVNPRQCINWLISSFTFGSLPANRTSLVPGIKEKRYSTISNFR